MDIQLQKYRHGLFHKLKDNIIDNCIIDINNKIGNKISFKIDKNNKTIQYDIFKDNSIIFTGIIYIDDKNNYIHQKDINDGFSISYRNKKDNISFKITFIKAVDGDFDPIINLLRLLENIE